SRQYPKSNCDRTHGARIAPVDTRLTIQDLSTYYVGFELEQDAFDLDLIRRRFSTLLGCTRQLLDYGGSGFPQLSGAFLFDADLIGSTDTLCRRGMNSGNERFITRCRLPLPCRLTGLTHEVIDSVDHHLHLF